MKRTNFLLVIAAFFLCGCTQQGDDASLAIDIEYKIDGHELVTDSVLYCNKAGNSYMVNEIQWFASRMQIQNVDGEWLDLDICDNESNICYLDTDIESSKHISALVTGGIGQYKAFRFVFGLNESDNISNRFVNAPESNMFWPEIMGGGYHYMKFNGKWISDDGLTPFNVHLGIGQNAEMTEFYQNHFTVVLPTDFELKPDNNRLTLCMDINNWFQNPNTYDFNFWGGSIMQNQQAQIALRENGQDVFSINNKNK